MDNRHAFGKYTFSDGANYEGEWHHGKQQGHGVLTFSNGFKYDGHFKNNMKHGIGYQQDQDGNFQKAEYFDG